MGSPGAILGSSRRAEFQLRFSAPLSVVGPLVGQDVAISAFASLSSLYIDITMMSPSPSVVVSVE